jgi:uncharacterized protein with HEPN domain
MADRIYWRLTDMKAAITDIRRLLETSDISVLSNDRATRAAYERFLEILSEASRHVPTDWKEEFSQIPWRQVADLGNFIRHAYHKIDIQILWSIYESDLDAIEHAVDTLLARSKPVER